MAPEEPTVSSFDTYRQEAGLSRAELWLRYFELGGMSTAAELDRLLSGEGTPSPDEHDLIAHAINERFSELGDDHPVRYVTHLEL